MSPPPPEAAPDRPRRRVSAAELFERVVPDDPPTMPFGRAKRADVDATTLRMKSSPAPDELSPDEQRTIPLGGDEDDTQRLDRD
jgi:hypothetical protein